ncbi:MAG TPA: class I SAM-dependent methyltransferase [Anaerolineales bacterium]|nr:class I SAM-dependent methyltransferase [Anaerolineales bacterium]
MEINYQETTSDLLKRIDIHKIYGGKDIDRWMLDLLSPRNGSTILDVGCGAGKQCFLYNQFTGGTARITGGDINAELLMKARFENQKIGNPVTFMELDFNERFPLDENTFDLESCCFAIYYAKDIPATIKEMHRVLKPGGKLFTSGPMPENKQLFYDVIKEATGETIPPMPGSSRYSTEILNSLKNTFSKVETHVFENPLTFPEAAPFIEYTHASLSEDRKLWKNLFKGKDDFENVMKKIEIAANKRIKESGKLVMTKVVGGFIATK